MFRGGLPRVQETKAEAYMKGFKKGFKNMVKTIQLVLVVVLVVGAGGAVYHFLEWEKPKISIDRPFDTIGRDKDVTITVRDVKSGIRSVKVVFVQKDRELVAASVDLPQKGTFEKVLALKIIPRDLKLMDGEALFRVEAVDFSPLKNTSVTETKVTVDSIPPGIALLSRAHNINPGGTCLAVYRLTKAVEKSGVRCGDAFFPGYLTTGQGKPYYVCYFAIPRDVTRNTAMAVVATDKGGNEAITGIPFYIRSTRAFRKDTVTLGDAFVQQKSVEFQQVDKSLSGKSPTEIISTVNTKLRADGDEKIRSICARSAGTQLWQGIFLRMKNSAPKALFGDERTYLYQGQSLGNSVHLGIDLASTANAPIEAANSGSVIYADNLFLYGNTVIIDHGQGIFSQYGHMSSIAVKVGQQVTKGQFIGNSGATGFAGGDHLHFSILVNGIFVDPKEWWDPHWMRDNVEDKISQAQRL
jgi:murein DD-endopeptidase MepM/ murein hydrolase activator NlpD